MFLIPQNDSLSLFSQAALMELYHKFTFPQRAQIFETFLPDDVELPKRNPPYPSSMFPEATRHIISLLSCLLVYPDDKIVDEPILGYFSNFSKDHQPAFMYNYSQFLVDNMHKQFMNLTTQGMFKYTSVLIYMFSFQQGDSLPITLNKQDEQGVN